MTDDIRKHQVNTTDDYGRSAIFYAAYFSNLEGVELLQASDVFMNLTDVRHRTCLHYAAQNDCPKLIEAVYMAFKAQNDPIIINGQKSEKPQPHMARVPAAAFSPFKSKVDDEMEMKKKYELAQQSIREQEEQQEKEKEERRQAEEQDGSSDQGFEIEHETSQKEEFKVEDGDTTPQANLMGNLGEFFTKKAVIDVNDEKLDSLYSEMDKIDSLYIFKEETPKE